MFYVQQIFPETNVIYKITWKNIVEPDRLQMTIWHMHIACWISKATNTHSEYLILIFFHCRNGCMNAPECYVLCTLAVLLGTVIGSEYFGVHCN
jgi:hypothetical protein